METWALVGKVAADLLAGRTFESSSLRCGRVNLRELFCEEELYMWEDLDRLAFSCTSLGPMTRGLDGPGTSHDDGGRNALPVFELDYSAFGAAHTFVRKLRPKEREALERIYG